MGDSIAVARSAVARSNHRREQSSLLHHSHSNGSGQNTGEEEPYTIKCICGFADDTYDGNTVFCERCNTWQHIACYYYPETTLEDDFEHNCVDCNPSQRVRLDTAAANSRQRVLRLPQDLSDDRKTKRPGPKSHKKTKIRDANGIVPHTNGWSKHEVHANEIRGESPRDQGPPNKRTKTSHKYSFSASNSVSRPLEDRNRSGSHGSLVPQEQVKLPLTECPADFLSPDFIRVHHENTQFNHAQANLHLNIEITNLLTEWLDDQDSFYRATNGKTHNEVFQHFPQPIEELEQPIQKHLRVDSNVKFHGEHPIWPFLTVATDLVAGDYVGELRGSIGRTDEYIQDEGNQWAKLRHPDHFVFFHPCLPIYIDSRSEGTELRYARRSCQPNLKMETIITGPREYRFCFTASDDIPRDTEITIPWDTRCDPQLYRILDKVKTATSESDLQSVSQWVGNLLAHFGGCACEQQNGSGLCLLAHFDRRLSHLRSESHSRSAKPRKRAHVNKLSPSQATQPNNSRASSGGPSHTDADEDVDMEDYRSISRSTDNKSSRGTTPLQKDDPLGEISAMSEREKRKVLHTVKLFERLDHSQSTKTNQLPAPRRKKRSSGSNANTPTAATHKSNGQMDHDPSRMTPNAGVKFDSELGIHGSAPKSGRTLTMITPPVYNDALVQTEESDPCSPRSLVTSLHPRSFHLRKRSLLRRRRRPEPSSPVSQQNEPSNDHMSTLIQRSLHNAQFSQDVEINGASKISAPDYPSSGPLNALQPGISGERDLGVQKPAQSRSAPTHPPIKPPPPPWTSEMSPFSDAQNSRQRPYESSAPPLALDLVSVRDSNTATVAEPPVGTPATATIGTTADDASEIHQAAEGNRTGPITTNEMLAAKASPVKKKMSLSDYMSKRKTESPLLERTQSQGQTVLLGNHRTGSLKGDGPGPTLT